MAPPLRALFVLSLLSVTIYLALVYGKNWGGGGDEKAKGRMRRILSALKPSYDTQKVVLMSFITLTVLVTGILAIAYFQDHNKWENLRELFDRDKVVKTQHVYGEKSGVDLSDYDRKVNKLVPYLRGAEVVRFKEVGEAIEPFRSSDSSDDELHFSPNDWVHLRWEILDPRVCDTPAMALCGVEEGVELQRISIIDQSDSFKIPTAGSLVMRAFCYVKDERLDYYTLITPSIDLSETSIST